MFLKKNKQNSNASIVDVHESYRLYIIAGTHSIFRCKFLKEGSFGKRYKVCVNTKRRKQQYFRQIISFQNDVQFNTGVVMLVQENKDGRQMADNEWYFEDKVNNFKVYTFPLASGEDSSEDSPVSLYILKQEKWFKILEAKTPKRTTILSENQPTDTIPDD